MLKVYGSMLKEKARGRLFSFTVHIMCLLVISPVDGVVNGCSWWCVLIIMAQHVCIVYLWPVYIAVLCGPPGVVAGTPRRCYTGCLSGCS